MFYINVSNTLPGTDEYDSTLAHEFQHMIHWNVDRNETTWINEGMSELASYLNGYGPSGFVPFYMSTPGIQLNTWPEDDTTLPHYGAAYLFLHYFYERFGTDLTRQLASSPINGLESIDAVLAGAESGVTADELFIDWTIANALNDPELAEGRYHYREIPDLQTPTFALTIEDYPYADRAGLVSQYGASYIALEGRGEATLRFDGAEIVPVIPAVVRDTDRNPATDDTHVWWSNRGDDSNMTLTRAIDLTGVTQAALTYDIWYWIEYGWDYAYVEVSVDGGETFQVLQTPYTSSYNPFGNAYGPGYTGRSSEIADSDEDGWLRETIDLSDYAGQQILLRFEMITDDAVNQPGLAIDNICIEATGFCDDAEGGDAAWEAAGFVRLNNLLPQRFAAHVVLPQRGGGVDILPLTLDSLNRGELRLTLTGGEPALLVLSGLTRFTTEPASYSLELTMP
jgi:hypothetical protein